MQHLQPLSLRQSV